MHGSQTKCVEAVLFVCHRVGMPRGQSADVLRRPCTLWLSQWRNLCAWMLACAQVYRAHLKDRGSLSAVEDYGVTLLKNSYWSGLNRLKGTILPSPMKECVAHFEAYYKQLQPVGVPPPLSHAHVPS